MGFKIDSIEKMQSLGINLTEHIPEIDKETKEINTYISMLQDSISGRGIDSATEMLKNAIYFENSQIVQLLSDVCSFISKQTTIYAVNEETVVSELKDVQNVLNDITI